MSFLNVTRYVMPTYQTPNKENDDFNVVMTIGVPLVVIFLILLSLCMVLLYTKARRRAGAQGQRSPVTTLSAGVPMSTSAYISFMGRSSLMETSHRRNGSDLSPFPNERYIISVPPSYEDVMKETNASYASSPAYMSFSSLSNNINTPLPLSVGSSYPPPVYEPPASQQCNQVSSSDNVLTDSNRVHKTEDDTEVTPSERNDTNTSDSGGTQVVQDHSTTMQQ